jgi:hypothetical protein
MGQYVPEGILFGKRGVYLNLNLIGKNANGKWAQTFVSTEDNFTRDCPYPCSPPLYTAQWSNGSWFFDDPDRPEAEFPFPFTWLAQTSYLLPNQSGASFTIQWGFTLARGTATPIGPVLVQQPWLSQQQLINQARGAP